LISGTAAAASGTLTVQRTISEPAFGEFERLLERGFDVGGVRVGHGLDDDRSTAAHLDVANLYAVGFAARVARAGESEPAIWVREAIYSNSLANFRSQERAGTPSARGQNRGHHEIGNELIAGVDAKEFHGLLGEERTGELDGGNETQPDMESTSMPSSID